MQINDTKYSLGRLHPDLSHVVVTGARRWLQLDEPEEFNRIWDAESKRSLSAGAFMKETFLKLSDEKRFFIRNAAAEIFASEGYHHASISDICKNAGISNGALYKYFNNKEDLFLSIIDYGIDLIKGLYRQFATNSQVLPTFSAKFLPGSDECPWTGELLYPSTWIWAPALLTALQKKSADLEKSGGIFSRNF